MGKFLDCVCDNNLESLIIYGTPSRKDLEKQFSLIIAEYSELKGDTTEGTKEWKLSRDIVRLHNHLELVKLCIDFLRERYSESIAASLNKLGYSFKPSVPDPNQYQRLLDQAVSKSKTKYILLRQMQEELRQFTDKRVKDYKKPTRETYTRMLLEMEEMQHAAYDLDNITVAKYVLLENKYIDRIEQLQNRLKK